MWYYYSEKNRKKREEAERERRVKMKQSEFELDENEYIIDNHLYIVFFFGRIFYKYLIYFKFTLFLSFILGLYYPIFHIYIIWKYMVYYCEFMVVDEEISFDFTDETLQLLLLIRQGGYNGFENVHICMIYDELGYVYWDVDVHHELRSDRLYRYNIWKNWAGFADDYYIMENKKDYLIKKSEYMKEYLNEKVNIINDKEKIINLNRKGNVFFRKRHLSKINKIRNKFFYLLKDKKIYLDKNYCDYISYSKNRGSGSAKERFVELENENYNNFGSLHNIKLKYINEDKKDDYYK